MDFYELGNKLKAHKKEQASRLPWGAAGVAYGNPIHLLDAAQYVKLAWDFILNAAIKNAFNLQVSVTLRGGVDKKFDIAADLLSSFKALTD